jgi:peptide deformylase
MAVRKVAKIGNPILRKRAEPVFLEEIRSKDFKIFVDDMLDTMRQLDGVGLAAPQIHVSKQVVVIESSDNVRYPDGGDIPLTILINPVFTDMSPEMAEGWEGCLSVGDLRGIVKRSTKVTVEALDLEGNPVTLRAEGFFAVVLQHEIDHLYGKLFVDRMADNSSLTHVDELSRNSSLSAA